MGIAVSASEQAGLRVLCDLAPKYDCKLKEREASSVCHWARRRGHFKDLKDLFSQVIWTKIGTNLWSLVQDGQPEACSPTAPSDPADVPLDEDSIYPDVSQWKRNKEGAYEVPKNKERAKKEVLGGECTWKDAEEWMMAQYGERGKWSPWEKRELGVPLSPAEKERIRTQEMLKGWDKKREGERRTAQKGTEGGGKFRGARRLTENPLPSRDSAPPERDVTFHHKRRWRAVIQNVSLKGDLTMQPMLVPVVRQGNAAEWAPLSWNMTHKIQKI